MKRTAEDLYNELICCDLKQPYKLFQDGFAGMFVVLRFLQKSEGVLAGDISDALGITTARTAVVLNTLQRKGYIEKTKFSQDARKTIVKITENGKHALEKRKEIIINMINSFISILDNSEVETLYNITKKIVLAQAQKV